MNGAVGKLTMENTNETFVFSHFVLGRKVGKKSDRSGRIRKAGAKSAGSDAMRVDERERRRIYDAKKKKTSQNALGRRAVTASKRLVINSHLMRQSIKAVRPRQ